MENGADTTDNTDVGDKIDLIVTVCQRLASLLKEPVDSAGTKPRDLTAEVRNSIRSTCHDDLLVCIDTLASCAHFSHGYFEVLNIANKLQIPTSDESEPTQ